MKKLLGSTLALALLLPAGVNAEVFKNLQVSGGVDVQGVDGNNLTDFNTKNYDNISTVLTRITVKTDWDLLDNVHAHISLNDNTQAWGANPYSGNYAYTNYYNTKGIPNGSQSVGNELYALFMDEAYVKVKGMFGDVDATIGRQYYGEKGDIVAYFGPHDYFGMGVTSLDAARLDWQGDKVGVTVLGSKMLAANQYINTNPTEYDAFCPTCNNSGDQTLFGIVVNAKPSDNVSGAVSLYDRTTTNSVSNGVVQPDDTLYVADIKGKVTAGGAWLKAEYAKNFGQYRPYGSPTSGEVDANYDGWAFLADLGDKVDVNNVGALTGWGQLAVGSGANGRNVNSGAGVFQGIAGDYRPGDIYGQFLTLGNTQNGTFNSYNGSNWSNASVGGLVVIGAGAKITPASLSKLTVGASWWNLRYQNADAAALIAGSPAPGVYNNNGNGFIGNEYDLDVTWQQSENVSVTVSGGTFQPGNFIKAVNASNHNGNNPATLLAADFHLKF